MNAIRIYIMATAFIATCFTVNAQFVTLQNGEFWLAGERFYPRVMNFGAQLMYLNNGAGPVLVKSTAGGNCLPSEPYCLSCSTQAECSAQLLGEFQQCTLKGFNVVRLALTIRYVVPEDSVPAVGEIPSNYEGFLFEGMGNPTYSEVRKPMHYPYDPIVDANTANYFGYLENILDLAEQAGIKVILITGGGHNFDFGPEDPAHDHYPKLLEQMGLYFANHEALMAYDVYNEPQWHFLYDHPINNHIDITKQVVCQFTTQWYDALRVSDQNHLITIGGGGASDIMEWDPMVMKVDFISPHIYPWPREDEQWNPTRGYERFMGDVHWLYRNSPKPWIIGETGFSAEDQRSSDTIALDNPPNEWLYGTELQMANFAHESQQYTWDCNGAGYSWWILRDIKPLFHNLGYDYFGLLPLAVSANVMSNWKPAVFEFMNFEPHKSARGVCQESPSYYNSFYHTNPNNRIHGLVLDGLGHPISGAIIRGENFNVNATALKPSSTVSDSSGTFVIIPADDIGFSGTTISKLIVSAVGAEKRSLTGSAVINNLTITLSAVSLIQHDFLNGIDVESGTTQDFVGAASLTVSDVEVKSYATADFKARTLVRMLDGFHASSNSETHIYCEEAIFACSELGNFLHQNRLMDPNVEEPEATRQIEIQFKKAGNLITVFPNPSDRMFTILFKGDFDSNGTKKIELLDISGRLILETRTTLSTFELDMLSEAKGVYLLRVSVDQSTVLNKKLILQ
ncbi:MAG: cellulase family glycosylhydrolase [Flavobacteriales bacterium]|nr:cellulase family glycosylhydrolase [Flavobacteriales bacterium]